MSGAAFDLLADLLAPPDHAPRHSPLAKAANPAKPHVFTGVSGCFETCEELRLSANSEPEQTDPRQNLQLFAFVRKRDDAAEPTGDRGVSQPSQLSLSDIAKTASAPPAGPLTLAVLGLDAEARALLDVLLAIYPDTGAVSAKELTHASRLPLGLILSALSLLQTVGAVVQQGREWAPSRRLRLELPTEGVSGKQSLKLESTENDPQATLAGRCI